MYGKVQIGNETVEMVANAASPYIYKHIFREDFLLKIREAEPEADLFQKMGYVMAKQAEINGMSELMKLTIDGFYEWLMQFEAMDILAASDQISTIYLGQTESASVPKNEAE